MGGLVLWHLAFCILHWAPSASAQSVPTIAEIKVDSAFRLLQELPYLPAVEWPAQSDLDAMLATLAPPALNEAA